MVLVKRKQTPYPRKSVLKKTKTIKKRSSALKKRKSVTKKSIVKRKSVTKSSKKTKSITKRSSALKKRKSVKKPKKTIKKRKSVKKPKKRKGQKGGAGPVTNASLASLTRSMGALRINQTESEYHIDKLEKFLGSIPQEFNKFASYNQLSHTERKNFNKIKMLDRLYKFIGDDSNKIKPNDRAEVFNKLRLEFTTLVTDDTIPMKKMILNEITNYYNGVFTSSKQDLIAHWPIIEHAIRNNDASIQVASNDREGLIKYITNEIPNLDDTFNGKIYTTVVNTILYYTPGK